MTVLVAAWLPIVAMIWASRRTLGRRGRVAGATAVLGGALLVITIAWDVGHAWLAAVALLVAAHVIALRCVLDRDDAPATDRP